MEIFLSLICLYLIIHLYFCKRDLLKPILFCMFSCICSSILYQMEKPELGIIILSINVFMTGLLILISLHFSKYNNEFEVIKKSYKLPLSLVTLMLILGVLIVEIDRNYDLFIFDGEEKVLSTTLLEDSITNSNYSIMLIALMIMVCATSFVFMFRKERVK